MGWVETLAQFFAYDWDLEGLRLIAGYGADFNKVAETLTHQHGWLQTHKRELLAFLKAHGAKETWSEFWKSTNG